MQLALSIGFTGAFWLLLFLGAALFKVIGLNFLEELIRQPWFSIPLTTVTFAVAVQLTDVRDGLIRGVRTVALMLLSWLLLVLTVLVAGFLVALPFTGLDGLWDTGSATALVLSAAAALIILINTAYQDGRPDNLPPAVLRVAVRVAAVLLTPSDRHRPLGPGPADRPARPDARPDHRRCLRRRSASPMPSATALPPSRPSGRKSRLDEAAGADQYRHRRPGGRR